MKRITPAKIIQHKRILRIRAKRKAGRKQKNIFGRSSGYMRIKAPQTFGLRDSKTRKHLIDFINRIKKTHLTGSNILVDFSATRQMVADGALLFKAELCRLGRHLKPGQTYQCKLPHNVRIRQVLKQTEILDLLNYRGNIPTSLQDVVHWRTANGSNADGSKYEPVVGNYEGQVTPELLAGLYVGVTEAMTNTAQHAYTEGRNDILSIKSGDEGWWMFSQKKDGKLSVLFCDLGIGIPRSLPKQKPQLVKMLTKQRERVRANRAYIEGHSRVIYAVI